MGTVDLVYINIYDIENREVRRSIYLGSIGAVCSHTEEEGIKWTAISVGREKKRTATGVQGSN